MAEIDRLMIEARRTQLANPKDPKCSKYILVNPNLATMAAEIGRLRIFIESITLADGPYHDLDGHRIVADAYAVLKGQDNG